MGLLATIALALTAGLLWLGWLRLRDGRDERAEWQRLCALQPRQPQAFLPDQVADLPEPAQRYFRHVILPGARLWTVGEIDMGGQFSLGTRTRPGYRPMQARQVLAVPHGFVWRLWLRGGLPISGSDAAGWTRFRVLGLLPVARLGGDADHARAAFGRSVAEAVFWTPAALLPRPGVHWEAIGPDAARVTVQSGTLSQAVEVRLAPDGCPTEVSFLRWSNANAERLYRLQPFGGRLSDFHEVAGFRLPHRVEAGNFWGTPDYFPFYRAEVRAIRFSPLRQTDR
ncbi:MAG TPA: hypothetical protein PKA16_00780 [Ottowia sp.]|uniref:DUF6544 family protein n=1 Tax=Ottowia sp. TaxID=1898956 RepID=UPI002BEC5C96|nr:DUF6544 family protein [Ottowia sp.]HMN19905.1 hypothetical protein [Ottowia sp.]